MSLCYLKIWLSTARKLRFPQTELFASFAAVDYTFSPIQTIAKMTAANNGLHVTNPASSVELYRDVFDMEWTGGVVERDSPLPHAPQRPEYRVLAPPLARTHRNPSGADVWLAGFTNQLLAMEACHFANSLIFRLLMRVN